MGGGRSASPQSRMQAPLLTCYVASFQEKVGHVILRDFSDYPPEHTNYDKTNKKVLGKFKDEMNGKIITHFIGLKPKEYCYKVYGDEKEHKKSKGVVKHKVSNQLSYKTYEETLKKTVKKKSV